LYNIFKLIINYNSYFSFNIIFYPIGFKKGFFLLSDY